VLLLVALSVIYLAALPRLFMALAGWPAAGRVAVSAAILAPLAFLMGIPFPTCLQAVSDRTRGMVAWAWGVNGAASVVGVTVATLVAVHTGFRAVVLAAAAIYLTVPLSLSLLARSGLCCARTPRSPPPLLRGWSKRKISDAEESAI